MTAPFEIPAVDMVDPRDVHVGETVRLLPDAPITDRLVLGVEPGPLGVRYSLPGGREYLAMAGHQVARVRGERRD